jgi:benzodiazapine receptor
MTAEGSSLWMVIAVAGGITLLVALVGGVLTEVGEWYESLSFPSWRPPNWLFAPAWTLIFILIAASAVMGWERAQGGASRNWLVMLFAVNAILNVAWSGLFFRLRRPDWAFAELVMLWLSIVSLVVFLSGLSRTAALLLLPYLAWVTFAGLLNFKIVQLNRPFEGRS